MNMLKNDWIVVSEARNTYICLLLRGCEVSGREVKEYKRINSWKNMGGLLSRLEEDYEIIKRKHPILSKEGTQAVRYEISDLFLRFWFRYFIKYQRYIEIGNLKGLADIIKDDYKTYSGLTLEMYFRQKMMESNEFCDIGSWWQEKNVSDRNEIDSVEI